MSHGICLEQSICDDVQDRHCSLWTFNVICGKDFFIEILRKQLKCILYTKVHLSLLSNAPFTRPYICQRTSTYGDTSDKLGARFI